ncbi:hypothetical protein C8R42DRAFT_640692 [Lentinula raphanica]|nr:hypothetical protein C8R42DRAFT_640692 [Lentinula raphanica]
MARRSRRILRSLYAKRQARSTSRADGPGYIYAFVDRARRFKIGMTKNFAQRRAQWDKQCPSSTRRWLTPIAVKRRRRAGPKPDALIVTKSTSKSLSLLEMARSHGMMLFIPASESCEGVSTKHKICTKHAPNEPKRSSKIRTLRYPRRVLYSRAFSSRHLALSSPTLLQANKFMAGFMNDPRIFDWDNLCTPQTKALDRLLNGLGSQRVPPEFHLTSAASSIFGSQNSEDEQQASTRQVNDIAPLFQSPSDTILGSKRKPQIDRKNRKTIRDFVDDQARVDIVENMKEEHTVVEDIVSRIDEYSEKLNTVICSIREYLPEDMPVPSIEQFISSRDSAQVGMASHLESLGAHFDQMYNALRECQAGDAFSDDDIQGIYCESRR